jgi:DNA-binding CsgD family transcriptional regulator
VAGRVMGGFAGDLPLLGPAAALAVLRDAAAEARAGHSRAVFVSGVAGMGKTSLLTTARAEFESHGDTVLFAAGGHPLVEWFGALGSGDDHAVVHRLCRRAGAMLADGPLTVMIDDAHECAPLVLRWVDALLHRSAGQPLLVVLASDPDAANPAPTTGVEIELGPLSPAEIAELVTVRLGEAPDPRFLDLCVRLSGGNPRSARILLDGLRGTDPAEAEKVGERVLAEALPARLERVPADARRVATAVALVGAGAPQLVATLLELPSSTVAAGLDTLQRHGLLTHQVALDDVPHPLRLRAARLLHDEGAPPARVARLLVDLADLDEPWMYYALWDAAVDARRRGEPEAGVAFLNRALQALSGHTETLVELAAVLSDIDPEAAAAHLGSAIEKTTEPRTRALLADRLGVLSLRTRQAAAAFPLLCDVVDTLADQVDDEVRRRLESVTLGVGLHTAATAPEAIRRARAMPVPAGDTPAGRLALGMLAITAMVDGGSADQAVTYARAAASGAVNIHNGPVIVAARILDRAGLPAESLAVLDGLVAASRRGGTGRTHVHVLAVRSSVVSGMGRCADAEADAVAAMELARDHDWAAPRIAYASVLLDRGEHVRAEAVLNEIREPDFVWEHPGVLLVRAQAKYMLGDRDGALSSLLECGRGLAEAGIRSPMLVQWWLLAATILAEQGRHAQARPLVEEQVELLNRWGTPEAVGLGELATGVATDEVDLMVAAVERLTDSPARLSQLRAEIQVGTALLRAGDDAGARKYLRRAVDLATLCGHRTLRAAATGLLTAAGGRMRRPDVGGPGPLTAAERRVAEHASAGATNREISQELFISVRTVETHLSKVYRKLGVSSREEITRALREVERERVADGRA